MPDIVGTAVVKIAGLVDKSSFDTAGNTIAGGFRRALIPAIGALGALGVAAVKSIHAASDLGEQASKSGVIFGKQAGEIRKFADAAATSFGLSSTAALEATANFGIIAQGAGLAGNDAVAFSKKFTTLAADLASFNNTTPEEAITAIGAALRGESEPIRKYGVLLDDATLRNQALKDGLISSTKEALTPQQKALAASKVILEQTTKAQGDFGRTSESAANQARILAAQQENLSASIGQRLLPYYVQLQGVALAALDWMAKHQTTVAILAGVMGGLALAVVAVNVAMALLALNPVTLAIAAIIAVAAGLAVGFVILYKKSETFRTAVQNMGEKIKEVWEQKIKPALDKLRDKWDEISPKVEHFLNSIIIPLVGKILELATAITGKLLGALADLGGFIIPAGLDVLAGTLDNIATSIDKITQAVKDAKKNDVGGLLGLAKGFGVLPGLAASGGVNSGWTIVGERGPELVRLPHSSRVFSNPNSERMVAASGGGGNSFNLTQIFNAPSTAAEAAQEINWALQHGTRFGALTSARGVGA